MARGKRKTLEGWLAERIDDPDRLPAKLSAIMLFHMQGPSGRVEVHTVKIGRFANDVNAKKIADILQDMADTHAQDLQGMQMFEVQAFYGDSTTNPARFPMRVYNNPGETNHLATEPPTREGQTMQEMRWKEAFFAQVWRRQQAMDETAIRREEVMGTQVARLQHELNDAYAIMRDMFIQTRKDDHQMAMTQLTYERDTAERKKLLGMAPALVNTITGREVFPQETADTAIIESIAEALMNSSNADMQKVQQMASALPQALQMTLFARLQEIAKKKNDEREELKALAQAQAKKDIESGDEEVAGALPNGSGTPAQH